MTDACEKMLRLIEHHLQYGRENNSNALQEAPKVFWPMSTPATAEEAG